MRNLSLRLIVAVAAAALMVTAPLGCGKKKLTKPEDLASLVNTTVFTEPTEVHEGVGMDARVANPRSAAGGPLIVVSVRNDRTQELVVYFRDLAFITGPDRKNDLVTLTADTARLDNVMPLVLQPGERGAIGLPMKVSRTFQGSRLVYNNPRDNIRFFVTVQ